MDVSNLLYEAMSVKLSDTFMFCVVFSIDQSSYFVWVIFCDILTSLLYSPGILCAWTHALLQFLILESIIENDTRSVWD